MSKSFSKIYQLGKREIENIFKSDVEVTEKIDGSQFSFGIDANNSITFRSKGKELQFGACEKMFKLGEDYILANEVLIRKVLPPNSYVYGEFLNKPKHNVLAYSRVPKNNIIVFGVYDGLNYLENYEDIKAIADELGLETVPLIFKGKIESAEQIKELIKGTTSVLGKENIEGVVVKNYRQHTTIGDPGPCFGKYVRDEFKEQHNYEWKVGSKKSCIDTFIESFYAEGRLRKAYIHLKEAGKITDSLKDIGPLIVEVKKDINSEEVNTIKDFLFKQYIGQIERKATCGIPEWYKDVLLTGAFPNEKAKETEQDSTNG